MKEEGFTIIELLVVVSVILVLLAVATPSFYQQRQEFSLHKAAYQFAQDVRRAQDMALSSAEYVDSVGNRHAVAGYGIFLDLNSLGNTKYILYADNVASGQGNQEYDTLDFVVETIDLSLIDSQVLIKQIENVTSDSASINFDISNLNTSIDNLSFGQNSISIIFSLSSDPSKTKTTLINSVGLVQLQ